MILRLKTLLILSAPLMANARRLGQEEGARQLEDVGDYKQPLNWGDHFDKIGDGELDGIADGVSDFFDGIADGFKNGDTADGLGDFFENLTDGFDWGDGWPETWPNLTDGVADWFDFDFSQFDFDNFTWDLINWNHSTWDEFVGDMDFDRPDVDFCSILERAVGIGNDFGVEGDCSCKGGSGDLDGDLAIKCDFQYQCYEQNAPSCSEVKVNYTTGDEIAVGACVDYIGETIPEVCFSYSYDIANPGGQSCTAQYDGNECECEIEDFCLRLNCSMYLPGAAMDSCQFLQTTTGEDIATFLPQFPVLDENFTQFFDDIPWGSLDWENLDTKNFKMSSVEWGSNARTQSFRDVINVDPNDGLLCPILQTFLDMSDELSSDGGCTCNEGTDEGFSMSCSFNEACVSDDVCASVGLDFAFNKLGAVSSEACANFANDGHPETCFAFDIPLADSNLSPTCSATYGGRDCFCTISDEFCVAIDCSEHEPAAVTDSCQVIDLTKSDSLSLIPRFSKVQGTTSDGDDEDFGDTSSALSSSLVASLLTSLAGILVL
eukprot:scaffold925_cov129-Cylindrotheca_fusiformis.AAC.13